MGVLYVECKVCCEVKCKCYLHKSKPAREEEMENAVSPMRDAARGKKSCGCSAGASHYYKYND